MSGVLNPSSSTALEKISGIVNRITFHSAETGYSVLKVNSFQKPGELLTVIVYQTKVFAGATLDFYGEWVQHPSYGVQFKATRLIERKPATTHALEKYLGSGLIKGVGPQTAKKIVGHFKENTLEVFENSLDKLLQVKGIARVKLEMIRKAWNEHQEIRSVMLFLQAHDISTLFAVKIYKTYGNQAIKMVKNNPYRLAEDIYGIGFFSADKIALSLGLSEQAKERIQAAIQHVLQDARQEGHCYLTEDQIVNQVTELLSLSGSSAIVDSLKEMEQKELLKIRLLPGEDKSIHKCYYAHSLYYDEQYIAKKVLRLHAQKIRIHHAFTKQLLSTVCTSLNISLSDEQRDSVLGITSNAISILTGGPGCGKTTTTRALVALLKVMNKKVLLAAPTGRASQRMSEVIGMEAKTLHRLLEFDPAKGGFKRDELSPLEADFFIIDECSMLDVHLAAAVLRATPFNCQLLLIGDADQLPAVGAGNVLHDIISSGTVPCYQLTKVFRQAQQSQIIINAHQINRGIVPRIDSPFHRPMLWKQASDCLFIDAEEATQEQLRFISRVKKIAEKQKHHPIDTSAVQENEEELYNNETEFSLPNKFRHVDIEALLQAETQSEELMEVLKKVHPWSSLHYGLSAGVMIEKLYQSIIPRYYGSQAEVQILTPMTKGSLGTHNLNKIIQEKLNPPKPGKAQIVLGGKILREGDRIIQKRNNYDLNVFNGDIGKIVKIDSEEMQALMLYTSGKDVKEVMYEKDHLLDVDLAYAITIHKSQGSEFEAVIIPLATQHYTMMFRNLVYTALTRAKKLAVFVGTRKALSLAVNNEQSVTRQTSLQYLLKNG